MHELSLCQNVAEIILQQAEQHGARRITGVWLEIGALSCVEESAIRFSFDVVCQNTLAQGCELHIDIRPARSWCWDCSQVIEMTQWSARCPHCGGERVRVESGDTLKVKSIEVE